MTQHIPTAGLAVDVVPSTASLADASFGRRLLSVGPTTVVVAAGLTALEWSVMQLPENAAGTAASIGALAMTVPLVIARRRPVVAVAVLAVAAVMNGLLFGDFTRCAGAVPAVLFAAFAVGAWSRGRSRGWTSSLVGLLLAVVAILAQYRWDPALHADAGFLAMGPAAVLVAWGAGTGWDALMARRGRR